MQDTLPLVIVSHALPADWLASLAGRCRVIGPAGDPAAERPAGPLAPELLPHLAQAEGLLTLLTVPVDETLLAQAPRLRVVSNMAVGVDNISLPACTRRGIPVGHTPGVLTDATADLTLALLLSIARGLPTAAADARAGRWGAWMPTRWLGADLAGATLGVIGLGQIGAAVAQRGRAFGLDIVYHNRQPRPDLDTRLAATWLPLADLLQRSDFVSLHVPLTPQTRGLIGAAELRLMKPAAYLVNVARGPVVDTAGLLHALSAGWIAGAALDVTDPEPLPPTHPLYQLPNCLIAPHLGSATFGARRRMAELACANLLAGLAGQPLPHCVNPNIGKGIS